MITAPGLYPDVPEADYHSDPLPAPSLSNSLAQVLMTRSPLHAWWGHPRLNPKRRERKPSRQMEAGTVLHSLILLDQEIVGPLDFKDWRTTTASKEARDASRAAGRIPSLRARWDEIRPVRDAVHRQLAQYRHVPDALQGGRPEVLIAWQQQTRHGPIWCRSRIDYLKPRSVTDLKTTEGSAEPLAWSRNAYRDGRGFQAAFYMRGLAALGHPVERFVYLAVETEPPYALSLIECSDELLEIAERVARHEGWPVALPRLKCSRSGGCCLS